VIRAALETAGEIFVAENGEKGGLRRGGGAHEQVRRHLVEDGIFAARGGGFVPPALEPVPPEPPLPLLRRDVCQHVAGG